MSLNNMMQEVAVVSQAHAVATQLLAAALQGDKRAIPCGDDCKALVAAFENLSTGIHAKMKADYDRILNEPADGGHPVGQK